MTTNAAARPRQPLVQLPAAPRPRTPAPRPPSAPAFAPGPAAPSPSIRRIIAVQTALDRENFSPGCIDGKAGPRTQYALQAWQIRHGEPPRGELDGRLLERLGDERSAFTTCTVTDNDHAVLTCVPDTWVGKSKVDRLGFETILEMMAERHHCSEGALRFLNPGVAWPDPPAGTVLSVPNPSPSPRPQAARLLVDISRKFIRAYDDKDRLIAHFPCSIARKAEKRPTGAATVSNAAANPDYTFDPTLFDEDPEAASITRKLRIPPGPNNPVGVAWVGISLPGYGMHGTPKPEDIGKTESHGCFRLANWNAQRLLRMVRIGIPIQFEP